MLIEVEAKFSLADQRAGKALLALQELGGLALGPWSQHEVVDVYLDTPARALQAAGYACRLRRDGGRAWLMLKATTPASGVIKRRREVQLELEPAAAPPEPGNLAAGELRELVGRLAGSAPLEPLFTIRQERQVCQLLDGERPVAELSLDRSRIDGGPPAVELEIELLPAGQAAELDRLVGILSDEWGLAPQLRSKFERGLDRLALLARKYPAIEPADPMSEAGRKTLQLHLERMLAHEAGTRDGTDIEELHDMRVATRRMRAALRVFEPYFEPAAIRPLVKGLRRTGRALGPVRDLDVLAEKAGHYLARLPAEQASALDPLLAAWQEQRELARAVMLAYLDSGRYRRFITRLGHFVATPAAGARPVPAGEPVPYQVRHVAPQLIVARYEAVRAYEPLLAGAPIELLHALRIDMKQLRYALEFFVPVLGPEAAEVIEAVKRVQDHLGDLNDADVAVRMLDAMNRPEPGVGAYREYRAEERQQLLASWPAVWERFCRPGLRRDLAQATVAC